MSADVDVCIIGGGLAGICAALAAKEAGASVLVLESTDRAGGKAKTLDGMERGPQSFNGRYEDMWRLLDALKLSDEAYELGSAARTRYLARGGKLHALEPSPLTLFTTGALTAQEKLALVRDAAGRRPVKPAASIHDFFAERFGRSFADGPVSAMMNGIWTGDPHRLAMDGCFPGVMERCVQKKSVLRGMMSGPKTGRRGFFRLKGGMGRIGEAAAKLLPIELSAPVREVQRDGSGFWVNAGRQIHARSLVVATEATAAAKLLWPIAPKLGAALGQLEYAPISVVHWESDDARFGPGFGYLACPSERLFALGTMFHGRRFSTFVRGAGEDDAVLAEGVTRDVRALTGGSVGKVLRIDRWTHAVFQPTVDALQVRSSIQPLAADAGVQLAGSWLGAGAMKDALASGFDAGKKAHEASQRIQAWSRSLS